MQIEIRAVDLDNPEHQSGLLGVLDSYASDPRGGGQPLRADVRQRLIPALQGHPTAYILLAYIDQQAVGLAVSFFGFSTFQAAPLLNIHDLAVVPAVRGKGVGRALLTAVEEHARERGCCKLTLEVQDDNTPARGLYESCGFVDFVVGESAPTRFLAKPLT